MNDDREQNKWASFNFVENLKTKRSWQVGVLVIILLTFMVHFMSQARTRKERYEAAMSHKVEDEKREIYKEAELKKKLSSVTLKEEKKRAPEPMKKSKRNYGTEAALFIYEKPEKNPEKRPDKKRKVQKLGLPAGAKISALTVGTIFSFNQAAPVIVEVTKDVEKDGVVIIPKNSQFLGEAGILKSLNRINVNFGLLIFPDGKQMSVRAIALSEDGSAGIKGKVQKHRDMKILKALGESVLAGAALFSSGLRQDAYSLEDRLRENAFENLTGMARQDLRSVKVDTSITVSGFTPIQVILLDAA